MPRLTFRTILLLALLLAFLAGCSSQASSGPAKAVEGYLEAMVTQNPDKMVTLSCAAWEAQARTDADALTGVTAKLDGVSCQESGKDGATTLVTCKGKIVATYNNENQDIPLEGRTYKVVQEANEWRMCGYK